MGLREDDFKDLNSPRSKFIIWSPQGNKVLKNVWLNHSQLAHCLLYSRKTGETVQVGVDVLGDQFLGQVGGEEVRYE